VDKFLAKHAAVTTGTLSCFDRLLFKGHLALGYDMGADFRWGEQRTNTPRSHLISPSPRTPLNAMRHKGFLPFRHF
jgi:hypothetical protein